MDRRHRRLQRELWDPWLASAGVGVGLLHAETAAEALRRGDVQLIYEAPSPVRVLFAHLASRAQDPLVRAASEIVAAGPTS